MEALSGRVIGSDDGGFLLAEWWEPGGPSGPPRYVAPLHVHHGDDEAWYVLEGTLRFRLGDEEIDAPAGSAVFAARGVPHTYWNPGKVTARYVLVMTPNTRALIDALHSPGARDRAAMRALYREHNCDLVDE
jgi:uncharacterized cupin superfamily protein